MNVVIIRENYRISTKLRLVDNNKVTNYNGFIAAVTQKKSVMFVKTMLPLTEIFSQ